MLASGAKTIDELSGHLELDRSIVSGVTYGMKRDGEVSSEWDSNEDAFVWFLTGSAKVERMTNAQKRTLCREALRLGKNLPRAIAAFARLTEAETIETLKQMEDDSEIFRKIEPTFSAFFLKGQVPSGKLILDGSGGVAIVGIAPAQNISDLTRAEAEEKLERLNQKIIEEKKQMEQIQTESTKIESAPAAVNFKPAVKEYLVQPTPIEKPKQKTAGKPGVKKGTAYSEEMFEDFGQRGLSKPDIAKELGVHVSAVYYQLQSKLNYAEAYKRGLKNCVISSDTKPQIGKSHRIEWTEEKLEDLATRHFECIKAAEDLGVHPTSINRQLAIEPKFLAAWLRGQEKYLEANPNYKVHPKSWYFKAKKMGVAFKAQDVIDKPKPEPVEAVLVSDNRLARTLEHISKEKPLPIGALQISSFLPSDEEVEENLTLMENRNQQKNINLGNGASLNLELENFNIFEADQQTRTFLHHFINQIQGFEKGKSEKDSV